MDIVILAQTCSLPLKFLLSVSKLGKRSRRSLFFPREPVKRLTFLDSENAGLCLSENPNT